MQKTHSFHAIRQAGKSALDALDALALLQAGLSKQSLAQGPGRTLSFLLLKKHCLQLSVQAHKCIHLLASMTGSKEEALRAVFTEQLQAIDTLLGHSPLPDAGPLLIPLNKSNQRLARPFFQANPDAFSAALPPSSPSLQGFVISRNASRYFFHTDGQLFPRINHALQQLDASRLETVFTISARIEALILAQPLPDALKNELENYCRSLGQSSRHASITCIARVQSEDGKRSSFAGLCPVQKTTLGGEVDNLERVYKAMLASLYSPQCLTYMLARGLRHERTEMEVLCICTKDDAVCAETRQESMLVGVDVASGAVHQGRTDHLAQQCSPLPRSTAGSPVERVLVQLCDLTGAAPLRQGHACSVLHGDPACSSMLDLIVHCRQQAIRAMMPAGQHIGVLLLCPDLHFNFYDCDYPGRPAPLDVKKEKLLHIEDIPSTLLQSLWQAMTVQGQHHLDQLTALPQTQRHSSPQHQWKNSVLLAAKYCTVEILDTDFHWQLTADLDLHGRALHLIFLIRDDRSGAPARLGHLAELAGAAGMAIRRTAAGLVIVHHETREESFVQHLQLLGAAGIRACLEANQA